MRNVRTPVCLAAIILALSEFPLSAEEEPIASADAGKLVFREQIRPILTGKCLTCHAGDKKKGGLDLTRRASALAGGKSGPAVLPGKGPESLLFQKLQAQEMPPQNPLSAEQIEAFRTWIKA